jgi:hypothetical protein
VRSREGVGAGGVVATRATVDSGSVSHVGRGRAAKQMGRKRSPKTAASSGRTGFSANRLRLVLSVWFKPR